MPELERLLVDAKVDLYLSGHHHVFYAAERNGLRMISVGPLGDAVRDLVDGTPSAKTLLVAEYDAEARLSLQAWTGEHFEARLPSHALPPAIGVSQHRLSRLSLERQESIEELEAAASSKAWAELRGPSVPTAPPLLPLEALTAP
jgi:hypothetical protein